MSKEKIEVIYICFDSEKEVVDVIKAPSMEKAEEHVIKQIADLADISYEEAKEDFEEWYDLRAYEVSVVNGEENG
ncbi:hypothetical protein DRH29_04535 [candidate division Kazan bacterium]|uniref:Uncharacterized protein n=1 Tax=candidate division Kazan bacterium TaxID=2202143 RepID=A0A420ZBK8_UNCK3|nr:MAG: hypothetical protein DRH29_04535 [candidate division Kazan bacterium]